MNPLILQNIIIGGALLLTVITLVLAARSGALFHVRFGKLEISTARREAAEARAVIQRIVSPEGVPLPFETEELAKYYGSVLAQSKTSFWFSLVFASLGFLVIIAAAFMFSNPTGPSGYAKFVAGLIIDSVAALFFAQSQRAQTAMATFFDKLRRDRLHAESRALCEGLQDQKARDALSIHLALHYAEVENVETVAKNITELCFARDKVLSAKPPPSENASSAMTAAK